MRPLKIAPVCYRKSLGVCAGLAYSLGIPVWTVRIIFLLLIFFFFLGPVIYIILAVCLSEWRVAPAGMEMESI